MAEDKSVEFTTQWLRVLKGEPGRQFEFYDSKLKIGFGVRVGVRQKSFFLSYRTKGGKKRRYIVGHWPTMSLKDARQKAKEINANRLDPGLVREQERKLGNFHGLVIEFKKDYRDVVRPRTWQEYERMLDQLVKSRDHGGEGWGELAISDIAPHLIKSFLREKAQKHQFASNRYRGVLHKLFVWAVEEGFVDMNPVSAVKRQGFRGGKGEPSRDRVLKHEEIRGIWGATEKLPPQAKTFVRLLFFTGLRRSEVLNAKWEDVDFESRWWRVPQTATKGGFRLDVPLTDPMVDLLRSVRFVTGHTPFVLSSLLTKEPTPISGFSKIKKKLDKESGVHRWRFHDIRRTVTTSLSELGVSDEIKRAVLGQAVPGVLGVYDRNTYALQKRQALERWADKLHDIITSKEADVAPLRSKSNV